MVGRLLPIVVIALPMRLATIDIGTNTAQLLVADLTEPGVERHHVAERFVRLGEGVDERGRISEAATERLCRTLEEHVTTAGRYGAEQIVAAGTSALRDATNRNAVLATVEERLGLHIDILSGPEEATWSFAAACAPFEDLSGACLVVDIGGGSTELVAGRDPSVFAPHYSEAITDRASLDVGCVRLTERCFASLPPSSDAIGEAEKHFDDALTTASLETESTPTLIGSAGTATALALVHAGPESTWNALHGNGFTLSQEEVHYWRNRLLQLSADEIRALHPEAMEGRADVFPVGVLLLDRILQQFERDAIRVSPYELRHGLALRTLAHQETP